MEGHNKMVPITGSDRMLDRLFDLAWFALPCPEADGGDRVASVECDGWLRRHVCAKVADEVAQSKPGAHLQN
jgi:hypothetical protein